MKSKAMNCLICKKALDESDSYEYRGAIACAEHFDQVVAKRDFERQEIIEEESRKTEKFKGLDLSDSTIGQANRKILKPAMEIAAKESSRLKKYERPND